jgi:hypothetical protein
VAGSGCATHVHVDGQLAAVAHGMVFPRQEEVDSTVVVLASIYSVISYVLDHRREVDEYVMQRHDVAAGVRAEIEARYPPARPPCATPGSTVVVGHGGNRFLVDEDVNDDWVRRAAAA